MKKFLLLSLGVATAAVSFAKLAKSTHHKAAHLSNAIKANAHAGEFISSIKQTNFTAAKTTDVAYDTIPYLNNTEANLVTNAVYFADSYSGSLDSGLLFGPNASGYSAFAENFSLSSFFGGTLPSGVSAQIIGVVSFWVGVANPNSTHSVNCVIWNVDESEHTDPFNPNWFLVNIPGATQLASQSVPLSQLSLDGSETITLFNTPVNFDSDFYAGFVPSFTFDQANGDTISLLSSPFDSSYINGYYGLDANNDTVAVGANTTMINNVWNDNFWDLGFNVDYSIIPIIVVADSTGSSTSVPGITKNNLTIFSSYPNPAVNSTNLKFSLKNNADVTIKLIDATGRVVNTINETNLSSGVHTVNISTASLPAGNYIYMFRTSDGSALASQLTVIK